MEAVFLHRVRFLDYFCPKQGQDFKPSAAPLYPNMGKVAPPPPRADMLFTCALFTCVYSVKISHILLPFLLMSIILPHSHSNCCMSIIKTILNSLKKKL